MATYSGNTASESEQQPSNNEDEDQDQDQPEREKVEVDKEYFDEILGSLEHLISLFNILQINPSVAPLSPSPSDEVPLGKTEVRVPMSELQKVKKRSIKSYTEGLVDLLFTPETLRASTLKGKSSKGQLRDTLDPVKVNAIIEQVRSVFKGAAVGYVEQLISQKCNSARKLSTATGEH
ncbi:hypothetical protein SRHO_G00130260 [Serrasalmus rhombeus]